MTHRCGTGASINRNAETSAEQKTIGGMENTRKENTISYAETAILSFDMRELQDNMQLYEVAQPSDRL